MKPVQPITDLPDRARTGQGVGVSRLFAGQERLALYESPTGLYFFEPRIVGDGRFYEDYYRRWDVHE